MPIYCMGPWKLQRLRKKVLLTARMTDFPPKILHTGRQPQCVIYDPTILFQPFKKTSARLTVPFASQLIAQLYAKKPVRRTILRLVY